MKTDAINACIYWLEQTVIGLNFCPFAREVVEGGAIRYADSTATIHQEIIEFLEREVDYLNDNEHVATSLLVLSQACTDFFEFLDLVDECNVWLLEQEYEGVYQLAHFHPDYCFAGEEAGDASNYTNRSPFPILHLLREEAIDDALENYADPEAIPERNIKVAREHGADFFKEILKKSVNKKI